MRKLWPLGLYRVAGHSMQPTHRPGDVVLGCRWFVPRPGQTVVARAGGDPLLKRIERIDGRQVWLAGDNPADSHDSRHFGAVDRSQLEAVIVPWRRAGLVAAALVAVAGAAVFAAAAIRPPGRGVYRAPAPTPTATAAQPSPAATPPYAMSAGPAPKAPLTVPAGYAIHVFADRQGTARDLQFSPGGTLLVSDPKARTITALPDSNHDGAADSAKIILTGGDNPHGLAFRGGYLYVAETGRVMRYAWDETTLAATTGQELFKLPTPNPDHNKRTITFGADDQLYISVGSTCNVCRESDPHSATILTADADGHNLRTFASGLRNAPFMAINPATKELWSTEMGRDNLGDTTPPDEIDIIHDGSNYGWPICYGAKIHDTAFDHAAYLADPCASTVGPIYGVPAHNAPLGLAFIASPQWPTDQQGDLLVAYHGSWNRSVPDGYKVVRLTVRGNTITGTTDIVTGFIAGRSVSARPVDLTFDALGNLYLSDDYSGTIYLIQKQL
ncbi:MAG TPA: PQQ-dependent sugar dehydrogenase [Candidatus Saccharimonadia bacterium]|nr:PQQ-dependent sugar dehydrogenase [Candidatus Saccharimonadia bacterium]